MATNSLKICLPNFTKFLVPLHSGLQLLFYSYHLTIKILKVQPWRKSQVSKEGNSGEEHLHEEPMIRCREKAI